jgi:hypothetical protein
MNVYPRIVFSAIHYTYFFYNKQNIWTALITQNTTETKCITSDSQNANKLQYNLFLILIHLLLATSNGWSAFTSVNHLQGQLQAPQ